MDPISLTYRASEILAVCVRLQQMETACETYAVAELMRMVVQAEPSEEIAVILCRLLFRTRTDQPLRMPARGWPVCLGDTEAADWPTVPVHVFQGVPFLVSWGWRLFGAAEPVPCYLAYGLTRGTWTSHRYAQVSAAAMPLAADEFIKQGPWRRPLEEFERKFIHRQVDELRLIP